MKSQEINFFVQYNSCRDTEKFTNILFGSEYKREISISQAADNNSFLVRWNERVVIRHSYAEFIEMKRPNVGNYAFIRRDEANEC